MMFNCVVPDIKNSTGSLQNMGEFSQDLNYCPSSRSPCNGGGYISLSEADCYLQTGIPPNTPSLTLDDFIQATPVIHRFWQHRKPYSSNSSIFSKSLSKTGHKAELKDNGRTKDGYRGARRNLKEMSYDEQIRGSDSARDVASSSGRSESFTESVYQYLPTYYSSVHRDPSGYYSNIYNNGNSDDRQNSRSAYASNAEEIPDETLSTVRFPKSCDEGESTLSESSFMSESFSAISSLDRIVCNTSKRSESSSSSSPLLSSSTQSISPSSTHSSSPPTPSSLRHGGNTSNGHDSSAHDSGIMDPEVVVKSEASDSESVNKDFNNLILDGGLEIGPPVLYTGQSNHYLNNSLDALHLKKKSSKTVFCVQCVSSSPGCQKLQEPPCSAGEINQTECSSPTAVDNTAISKCHDRSAADIKCPLVEVCDSQPGCKVHCSEYSHVMLTLDTKEKGSHLCLGCQKPVFDRYVLHVKDHGYWHAECLKCSNCQDNLSTQKSCYVKNEQVFCRNDYNILFGLSCVKCSLQFKKEQDWMRVAGQHRYHIACFLCKICKRQLGNNEKYHLVNGTDIYCTNHYRDMVNGENSDGQQPPKKAKRNRTSYTETQIKFLQDRFLRDSNPDGGELEKIAKHIGLKKRVVQVWFQNNRARLKKSANNNKGGNQENKNPTTSNGITGPGNMHDFQTMDWDNSLEPKSMDEQSYSNSPTHSHTRPSSAHFLDTTYSMTPGLTAAINTPLLCLPPGHTSTSSLGNGPSSLGEGSGSGGSNCDTPRDQGSPQFSDLSTPAMTTAGDSSTEDVAVSGPQEFPPMTCANGSSLRHPPLMSALRSSVMCDKFPDSLGLRGDLHESPQPAGRLFHDDVHHRSLHHPDPGYGAAHLGLYGGFYNMCNTPYHSRDSMVGDPTTCTDGFLRHRESHPPSYMGSSQNSIFGQDANPSVNPPSSPLCNIGFPSGPTSGQQSCSPPVSCHFTSGQGRNQSSPQLFNYLTGYGRSSCSSPPHPGRQSVGQFQFVLNANSGSRLKGNSFFNESSD